MDHTEEKKVGIPESITINGVTYTVKDTPELQQFIQEVAKVEKSKLYTQFENLKSQIANLGKVKVVDEGSSNNAIVDKLKDVFVTKEDFKEILPGILKDVVQPVLTATEQSRKNELAQYRENLIKENIATCIPDLVKGDTKEELDASLQESIRLRAAYPTPSTVGITGPVKDPLIAKQAADMEKENPLPQQPVVPTVPRRPSPEVDSAINVKKMSMEEFSRRREDLQSQLRSMYGDSL